MPSSEQSLAVLRNLLSMGGGGDPRVEALRLRREQSLQRSPQGIGGMTPGLQSEIGAIESDIEADPFTKRYRDVGEAQTEGAIYDLPESRQMRDDALMRTLAPERLRGEYGLERQKIASGGIVQAAQARMAGATDARQAARERSEFLEKGRMKRARNTMLESQAKAAESSRRGPLEWLLPESLGGKPSPAEQAATIRGQQQFEIPETDGGADTDLREQVAAALQANGIDPSYVDEVMADPEAMAELGF